MQAGVQQQKVNQHEPPKDAHLDNNFDYRKKSLTYVGLVEKLKAQRNSQ